MSLATTVKYIGELPQQRSPHLDSLPWMQRPTVVRRASTKLPTCDTYVLGEHRMRHVGLKSAGSIETSEKLLALYSAPLVNRNGSRKRVRVVLFTVSLRRYDSSSSWSADECSVQLVCNRELSSRTSSGAGSQAVIDYCYAVWSIKQRPTNIELIDCGLVNWISTSKWYYRVAYQSIAALFVLYVQFIQL